MLYVLIFPLLILYFSGWSAVAPYGLSSLNNAGPHGLSEILYAYSSAAGNNGSAFAGLNANTPWYNVTQGLTMLAGRFLMIIPVLAIAGSYGRQKSRAGKLRHFPDKRDSFRRAAGRCGSYRRRVDFLPRALRLGLSSNILSPWQERFTNMADTRLKERSLFDPEIVRPAVWESFRKLVPQHVIKNPVMFVVEIGSVLTTLIWLRDLIAPTAGSQPLWFTFNVAFWLWFTVVFANFAEAVAEGRGKAQAATLRKMRKETDRASAGEW